MRLLSRDLYEAHSRYLGAVREFFRSRGFLEIETPLLNRQGSVELHLDSLAVRRRGVRKSPEAPVPGDSANSADSAAIPDDPDLAGYLITSPEYNLKIVLSELQRSIFQLAHAFREGDIGQIHSEEFLMLEWYLVGADEFALMDQCEEFLQHLAGCFDFSRIRLNKQTKFRRRPVSELLQTHADCPDFSRQALLTALDRHRLLNPAERARPDEIPYDELFFSLFLNRVEEHLGIDGPEFVYDYPPELAALSRVEGGRARRFEIYWRRVELANGYYELTDPAEQRRRFDLDNQNRRRAGKPEMQPDPAFLAALDRGLPECSGIALGLDRLFMLLRDSESLAEVSMY